MQAIVIYDGTCSLCNGTVRFLRRHDRGSHFNFITGQSDRGKTLLAEHKLSGADNDTVILINEGRYYLRSDAALMTMKLLGGGWSLLYQLRIIPAPLRDLVYRFIARNRHHWPRRNDRC